MPGASPSEADRGGISRRSLLLTAAGVAVLGGGAATAAGLLTRPPAPLTVDEMLRQHPFRIAHRGGSDDWPEMSAYAYRQAVARRYGALEFSAARSSDGVWFGLHDGTLDRTSGTKGFVAAEHTWAEIQKLRISASATTAPHQPARPYLRLRDFLAEFGSSHVLLLDPKSADAPARQEMLDEIRRAVPHANRQVIAKSYGESVPWAQEAESAGFRHVGLLLRRGRHQRAAGQDRRGLDDARYGLQRSGLGLGGGRRPAQARHRPRAAHRAGRPDGAGPRCGRRGRRGRAGHQQLRGSRGGPLRVSPCIIGRPSCPKRPVGRAARRARSRSRAPRR